LSIDDCRLKEWTIFKVAALNAQWGRTTGDQLPNENAD